MVWRLRHPIGHTPHPPSCPVFFELLVVRELAIGAVLAGSMNPREQMLSRCSPAVRIESPPALTMGAPVTRVEVYTEDTCGIAQAEGGGVGLCGGVLATGGIVLAARLCG